MAYSPMLFFSLHVHFPRRPPSYLYSAAGRFPSVTLSPPATIPNSYLYGDCFYETTYPSLDRDYPDDGIRRNGSERGYRIRTARMEPAMRGHTDHQLHDMHGHPPPPDNTGNGADHHSTVRHGSVDLPCGADNSWCFFPGGCHPSAHVPGTSCSGNFSVRSGCASLHHPGKCMGSRHRPWSSSGMLRRRLFLQEWRPELSLHDSDLPGDAAVHAVMARLPGPVMK